MRMRDVLWQIWLNCGYFLTVAASGFFLYKLCAPFVRPRNGRFWRVLLFLDRRPQPALYAAGVFRLVPPLYPG